MGQNRRPGSGTPREGPKAMNGVIAPSGVPLVAHYSHFCSAAHKPFTFALLCPF